MALGFGGFEPDLRWLLLPPGSKMTVAMIGQERGRPVRDGIVRYRGRDGEVYRYVAYENGEAVAGLQIVHGWGTDTWIASNLYVAAPHRRRGLATALYRRAQKDAPRLVNSEDQSDDAKAFLRMMGAR